MSFVDDPFDPAHQPAGCACGRHRSPQQHDAEQAYAARLMPQCAPAEVRPNGVGRRYESVVASAVARAMLRRMPHMR
ncbi:MAG TPA: hypothetical protein VGH49_15765 [Xanthobacteraceae bacterium]